MAGKDDSRSETVTLTRADLDAMIRAAVASGNDAATQHQRANAGLESPHATQEQRVHAMLGTPIPARECHKTMLAPCVNPRNGAQFTAVIAPSRKWVEGRVVDLIDYKYPDDLLTRYGGKAFPEGGGMGPKRDMIVHLAGGGTLQGPYNQDFLHWLWQEYGMADRKAFVGQSAKLLPTTGPAVERKLDSTARVVDATVATVGQASIG